MGKVVRSVFIEAESTGGLTGSLPRTATTSKGPIGKKTAVSSCGRINSTASPTVTEGKNLVAPNEVDMLGGLRVNRDFMAFMRVHYPEASKQHLDMAVINSEDNAPDSDPDKE